MTMVFNPAVFIPFDVAAIIPIRVGVPQNTVILYFWIRPANITGLNFPE